MNLKTLLLTAAAGIALATPASAETYQSDTTIRKDATGNYDEKNTTVKTDASGNTTTFEKEAAVGVGPDGEVDKSTTTKKVLDSADPLNSHVVRTKNSEQVRDGMVTTNQEVKVDGRVIDSKSETKPQ